MYVNLLNITGYGRIATEIKVNQSRDGKHTYTNFLLASHSKNETTFVRCIAFDGLANLFSEYFKKGDRLLIRGDLISDNAKKDALKIVVRDFEFVETKSSKQKGD